MERMAALLRRGERDRLRSGVVRERARGHEVRRETYMRKVLSPISDTRIVPVKRVGDLVELKGR